MRRRLRAPGRRSDRQGDVDFTATTFTLAVIGDTAKYRGAKGRVELAALGKSTQVQPVVKAVPMLQTQRLVFTLQGG